MNYHIIAVIILCFTIGACKQTDNSNQSGQEVASSTTTLDGLPTEILRNAVQNCNNIDIIFYNLPISVNQSDQNSVRGSLGFIGQKATQNVGGCPSIGRIFYNSDSGTVAEADIHFSDNCYYFGFLENNQVKYANEITPEGINFFSQLINSAQNPPTN